MGPGSADPSNPRGPLGAMDIASFRDFVELVREVWTEGVFGIQMTDTLLALLILAGFLLFRNLLTRFVLAACRRAAARTEVTLDEHILAALEPPLRFVPIVMGIFFATSVLEVESDAESFFQTANRSLVTFTLFWSFYRLVDPVGHLLMHARGVLTRPMIEWIQKAARVAFVALGAATILEMWGIAVAPIIAGLGLFGVAVALGAQDLFKNLISGLFVIGERRFHPGDWILVDGVVEGTVEEIGFRTTKVRRFDKSPVFVPNSKLSDTAVTNFSRMTHRRIHWMIGVEYRTTLEQLREIRDGIERYILENKEFASPGEVPTFVRVDGFSDSSIDILLYAFTRTIVWGEWLQIKEDLAYEIKRIVEGAGAGFAFPSRSLYLETLPEAPEVFPLSKPEGAAQAIAADRSGV